MKDHSSSRRFVSVMKASAFWVLAVLAALTVVSSVITRPAYGGSMGLVNLPAPFSSNGTMNSTAVVASSVGHGPCGGANTMDVMGAILVGGEFGLKTNNGNGTLEATMDDYISTYNFTTATVQLRDLSSNLIVVGGPGVNQITWYYNNLRNGSGDRVLPVYFDKFPNGTDYIYAVASNHSYTIERDGLGRVVADYGVILMFQDGARFVLILAGLGGSGTAAACQIISSYDSWALSGTAAIVKYSDTNGDGLLDTLSIVEKTSLPINTTNLASFLSFGLFSAALLPKLKAQRRKFSSKHQLSRLSIVLLLLLAVSQIAMIAFSDSPGPDFYTFKDFSHPFVSSGGLMNSTVVVASSVGHGPVGGANTMDVMGAIMVGARFGMDATGGSLCSTLDDYVSSYDMNTGQMNFSSLTSNLVVVGGPGVNQIAWYYNNLRNSTGSRVLPAYFDKFPNGTDYIYVPSSGHHYTVEHDSQGRVSADYGVVTLFQDTTHGWWVLIAAGLGGGGTLAALRLLTAHRSWSLFGQAVVVKDSDANGDGYLDTISVPELVGVGNSVDVFSDVNCQNAIRSIDWGTLNPGDAKNVTVYVRNEGQGGIVLALNTSGWTPPTASNYMSVGWNYSGGVVQSGQTVPIMLTLNVSSSVTGVTGFGVNITISSG